MTVHDTLIPCPYCSEGHVQWAKINFRRAEDNAFDWRLDSWCSHCGTPMTEHGYIVREIRIRYNALVGREIEAMQDAALVQHIGPELNTRLNGAVRSGQ